jgi:hypothetical protein
MTGILSAISGKFSKSLILGTFLPVLAFVILSLISWEALFLADRPAFDFEELSAPWRMIVVLSVTIVLSGLLYNLNIPVIRLYEGYPWRRSWVGEWRTRHYRKQFRACHARWQGMRTLLLAMRKVNAPHQQEIQAEWKQIALRLNSEFPKGEDLILPTRLGNVIRSFEDYSFRQYKIEAIRLWPRLVAKIDKDYAAAIDDAKTSFDFMLYSSALSALLTLWLLVSGFLSSTSLTASKLWLPWLLETVAFGVLTRWFYHLSIERASAWGHMVRGAFDLYRWDLLEQLGYRYVPATMVEERILWNDIVQQITYGDSPAIPLAEYTSRSSYARSPFPRSVELELARGVSRSIDSKVLKVTLLVRNVDSQKRIAKSVIVTDTVPDGYDYEWDSAQRCEDSGAVDVVGANPYRFHVGDLKFGQSASLTYRAISRRK